MKNLRHLTGISTLYRYAYAEYLLHLGVPASQVTSALGVDSGRLSEVNRNQQFIDIMKKTFKKKPYETMALRELALETGASLLAASIVTKDTYIQSVGQELGPMYDFDAQGGIDSNTGKTFSHEWETNLE